MSSFDGSTPPGAYCETDGVYEKGDTLPGPRGISETEWVHEVSAEGVFAHSAGAAAPLVALHSRSWPWKAQGRAFVTTRVL